ncbi:MAG: phosphatidate cytidylyltransferase [Pseudomonadota bacterium]
MLAKRVITASILAAGLITAILLLPTGAFAGLIAFFILLGAREWGDLSGCSRMGSVGYVALVAVLAAGVVLAEPAPVAVAAVGAAWWLGVLGLVIAHPRGEGVWRHPLGRAAGLLAIIPAWFSLVHLHGLADGPWWVLVLMFTIWGADTGAYFAGRALGRHRLAPSVSPGKTWEGAIGGLALALLAGSGVALAAGLTIPAGFSLVAAITVVASVVGDLGESLLKRAADRKDSGTLFPGHGGVLDRVDSLLAATPVFVLGLEVVA